MTERFRFCLPIWGETFVRTWLDVALPTQLAPGNLGDFPWARSSVLEVFTRDEDRRLMEASPAFRRLRETMDVAFVGIDHLMAKSMFGVYTECQRQAIRRADETDSALCFLSPDMVMSTGTLRNAALRIRAGSSAVMIPGNRCKKEELAPWLRERLVPDGTTIAVGARDLVRQSFVFMHANTESWFWNSERFDRTPAYLMWQVPGAGLVAYGYVLHPMMIKAEVKGATLANIFDQDYLALACPSLDRIHIVRDSDEAFICGLDPTERFRDHLIENRASAYDLAYWAEWAFNDHHRAFAKQPLRHRYADGREDDWLTAEAAGRNVVAEIASILSVPDWQLALVDRRRLLMRLRRRYRYAHKDLHNVGFVWSVVDNLPSLVKQLHLLRGNTSKADMAALEWLATEEEAPGASLTDPTTIEMRYKTTLEVVAKLKHQHESGNSKL